MTKRKALLPGDVVRLKSDDLSGPKMTIERGVLDSFRRLTFECVWFSGSELKRDMFRVEALVHA